MSNTICKAVVDTSIEVDNVYVLDVNLDNCWMSLVNVLINWIRDYFFVVKNGSVNLWKFNCDKFWVSLKYIKVHS
jgi:hypothetical protein